ncbi:MAG: hypothetical protein HN350_09905 [Phycisphaerales bacterium]|jgi:hypothetical protein|nr:hypothetical protein [Phycisphaerales bacterium]
MSQTQNTNIETPATKSTVDPDALMGKINGLSFLAMFIVSLLVHTVLIGATSVGFIQDCIAYKTLDPDSVLQEQAKKAQAAQRDKQRAERQAEDAKLAAENKNKKSKNPTTKPLTKIEQDINKTSTTLPATSGVNLDDIDEL